MTTASFARSPALAALADQTFDVVVVGGGITGAGAALDAASRGLKTALIERDDFASGTSSKSSKLVHGGFRYLQQREIRLVYEALAERQRLRSNAPHLVGMMPMLLPLLTKDGFIPAKVSRAVGMAMWMYDFTGGLRIGKFHKRLNADEAMEHLPVLHRENIAGAYIFYDCAADDARLTLTLARTAALDHGAVVANRVGAVGFEKSAAGKVEAVNVRTAEGDEFAVRTKVVINATGVWADEVRALDEGAESSTLRPAKGIHITLPAAMFENDIAAALPVRGDRRSVFLVPKGDVVYVGTTDTDYQGTLDDPQCTEADVTYLLNAVKGSTSARPTEQDILGTWAGLRPLVAQSKNDRTADLSRRHSVKASPAGVVTVTGGKLTTYRAMAADAVDAAMKTASMDRSRTKTKRLKLRGAKNHQKVSKGQSALTDAQATHLAGLYGGEANTAVSLVARRPELAAPLVAGSPDLAVQAVYAARHEMVNTLDDVLSRRTRLRLYARDQVDKAAPEIAALVGNELGWDKTRQQTEVADFRNLLDNERRSEGQEIPNR